MSVHPGSRWVSEYHAKISIETLFAAVAASRDLYPTFSNLIDYYLSFAETQPRSCQITRRFEELTGALFMPA